MTTATTLPQQPNTAIAEKVVEVNHLRKSFDGDLILEDITLHLLKGENLVVLGKSGSGKSVLIKCIAALLSFEEGKIDVLGNDIHALNYQKLSDLRKKIGFLFQRGALYDSMTVQQNLEFPLRRIRKDLNEAALQEKVLEALKNVDLADALLKMPSQLSGGMRKRISLARTIVVDPEIMLYDEPTTGLDPVTSKEISSLILDIQKKYNTSSIIITHDINCAVHTANRMMMIRNGVVYLEGNKESFMNSSDPEISAFFQ